MTCDDLKQDGLCRQQPPAREREWPLPSSLQLDPLEGEAEATEPSAMEATAQTELTDSDCENSKNQSRTA